MISKTDNAWTGLRTLVWMMKKPVLSASFGSSCRVRARGARLEMLVERKLEISPADDWRVRDESDTAIAATWRRIWSRAWNCCWYHCYLISPRDARATIWSRRADRCCIVAGWRGDKTRLDGFDWCFWWTEMNFGQDWVTVTRILNHILCTRTKITFTVSHGG